MEYLALSIFVSTVLVLVDRNHVWPQFWKFSKWACAVMLLIVLGLGGYYEYRQHQIKKASTADWFEQNAPH